jgi:transcriptional regulator of heat shock response
MKTVDHESRRKQVLAATINSYIRSGVPVASDEIAEVFQLSSATVRNIFAELEKTGHLAHLHTSGGRLPTNEGYRYYVDFLISELELLGEQKESILRELKLEIREMDVMLEKISAVISLISHYAGIASFFEWHDKLFYKGISYVLDQPEFKDYQRIRLLIKLIEEKERLLDILNRDIEGKVKVYIGKELGCAEINSCSLVVSSFNVKNKPSGRLAVLGPVRMEYKRIIPLLEYVSEVVSDALI